MKKLFVLAALQLAIACTTIDKPGATSAQAPRSANEISEVFKQNKNYIWLAYRTALTRKPAMEGSIVVTLVIAPSGEVSSVELETQGFHDPEFERDLIKLIRQFDFGKKGSRPDNVKHKLWFFASST